jgi:hypothetical protein
MPQYLTAPVQLTLLQRRQLVLSVAQDGCTVGLLSGILLLGLSAIAPRYAASAVGLLGVCSIIASAILRSVLGLHCLSHSLQSETEGASAQAVAIAEKAAKLSVWPKIGS